MDITPEHYWELLKFQRMLKYKRPRKLTPHLVWPDGTKEPIFVNCRGWYQADLYEAEDLETFYLEDLWDGLLDGVVVALRKNDNYQEEAFMAWADSL